jgi:plasmid stabilization system protein ParE
MVAGKLTVVIDNEAKSSLREAYKYIQKDSLQNAEKVRTAILSSFEELIKYPEKHAPDKYRIDKDPAYRAYEIYKYRISYHVSPTTIRIIRIRHTKMNPSPY